MHRSRSQHRCSTQAFQAGIQGFKALFALPSLPCRRRRIKSSNGYLQVDPNSSGILGGAVPHDSQASAQTMVTCNEPVSSHSGSLDHPALKGIIARRAPSGMLQQSGPRRLIGRAGKIQASSTGWVHHHGGCRKF